MLFFISVVRTFTYKQYIKFKVLSRICGTHQNIEASASMSHSDNVYTAWHDAVSNNTKGRACKLSVKIGQRCDVTDQ